MPLTRPFKAFLLLLWLLLALPLLAVSNLPRQKIYRDWSIRLIARGILLLLNVRLQVIGKPAASKPLLLVANHLSYMDIPILASAADCRFVAKQEIARWPLFGWICRMAEVIFIDRSISSIGKGQNAMRDALSRGHIVTLFPEATTGDGRHLLPFKPAFFEALESTAIQPVAIAYRRINGLPIDYSQWPLIAWYGDMALLPHLWALMALGRITVELHFLPCLADVPSGRKIIAAQTQEAIQSCLLIKN